MSTLLSKLTIVDAAPAGHGWRTAFKIHEEEAPEASLTYVRDLLRVGVDSGKVEAKKFYCPVRRSRVLHYRESQPGATKPKAKKK